MTILRQPSRLSTDRGTVRNISVIAVTVLVLMALIGVLTFLPAGTITSSAESQSAERQALLAASLARQIEGYFNILSNALIGLAIRPPIQSVGGQRAEALRLLTETGTAFNGGIKAIVRLARDGSPRYAWPEDYNARIAQNQPLPWTVDAVWVNQIVSTGGVQFVRRSTPEGAAYLLVSPVATGLGNNEVLAFEVPVQSYLQGLFASIDIGQSGQLWVLTTVGQVLYSARPTPEFAGGTAQLITISTTTTLPGYPTEDRESVVVPVYTSFTQNRGAFGSLALILSRTYAEARQVVAGVLQLLGAFSFGVIAFVALFGFLVGMYVLRESNRRRREESRRNTANTLLDISRALNSSLKLNEVLSRILGNLKTVIPHETASVFLVDEDERSFIVAAEVGEGVNNATGEQRRFPMSQIKGAFQVFTTGRPAVIADTTQDDRWIAMPNSPIRSWLGVPLRVRDETVGVLNINSNTPSRYTADDIDVAVAFADQAGVAIQNARSHELQIRVYEAELETARAIQESLLPQEAPPIPQVALGVRSRPARQVSGDYYQHFVLPDGRLGLAVGDVSGKGIPAALLMAVITTALRDEIVRFPTPDRLLNELNTRLLPRMQQNNMNSGLLVAFFDPHSRQAQVAAGGMLSPYLAADGALQEIEVGGYPLGAAALTAYRAESLSVPADGMLVFVTDGVIEAKNRAGELFGFERFESLLASLDPRLSAEQVAEAILAAVDNHLNGEEAQDDITIVVMRALAEPAPALS